MTTIAILAFSLALVLLFTHGLGSILLFFINMFNESQSTKGKENQVKWN